mmetsp:Transcript_21519/g.59805  ORF Transcript_21519/g.59805 Transcript_21519/m.59805 type:complete len:386 (+) Transcript_21519:244-1401(+)|eukprot:CAMPEP_0117672350 /NCGR_PEP_ID=MMETSP0804-20121206/13855_1 /TAXON_ID=1074897 /ORGANISM="Tetraselmis astigmatica, Strain CCMP880" /LENGTH=385 /DNA_ID=CAMNT_0005480941 /DNA_START=226 /DNA_END=1383 /DNA_ORIENTATION=-
MTVMEELPAGPSWLEGGGGGTAGRPPDRQSTKPVVVKDLRTMTTNDIMLMCTNRRSAVSWSTSITNDVGTSIKDLPGLLLPDPSKRHFSKYIGEESCPNWRLFNAVTATKASRPAKAAAKAKPRQPAKIRRPGQEAKPLQQPKPVHNARQEHSEFVTALSELLGRKVEAPQLSAVTRIVDLKTLFLEVAKAGGSAAADRSSAWEAVAQTVCEDKALHCSVRRAYLHYLLPLERQMPAGADLSRCTELCHSIARTLAQRPGHSSGRLVGEIASLARRQLSELSTSSSLSAVDVAAEAQMLACSLARGQDVAPHPAWPFPRPTKLGRKRSRSHEGMDKPAPQAQGPPPELVKAASSLLLSARVSRTGPPGAAQPPLPAVPASRRWAL